jgi:hypothetical protein
MTPRIVAAMAKGRLSDQEVAQLSDKILREASDAASLHMQLERLSKKWA